MNFKDTIDNVVDNISETYENISNTYQKAWNKGKKIAVKKVLEYANPEEAKYVDNPSKKPKFIMEGNYEDEVQDYIRITQTPTQRVLKNDGIFVANMQREFNTPEIPNIEQLVIGSYEPQHMRLSPVPQNQKLQTSRRQISEAVKNKDIPALETAIKILEEEKNYKFTLAHKAENYWEGHEAYDGNFHTLHLHSRDY